jgi:FlaA1/EpsC-like NDP-sugar epimerase
MAENTVLGAITGRDASLFKADLETHKAELTSIIKDARILVIGAGGSVGSSFVKQLCDFSPALLHLTDISENNLVELVRDLRSSPISLPEKFSAMPIALGAIEMERYLDTQQFDYILNFSALKHVRSEKDPFSLMRMYNTNVWNVHRILSRLHGENRVKKFFSVSSDKAVEPHNIMGATKIFMERVHVLHSDMVPFSTARFANVAFSDGSLLYGFRLRYQKHQPIAAPVDIRRYFISHEEAGQLCLLSCFLGKNRDIYFPKLDPNAHLVSFSEIALLFLKALGLQPDIYGNEEDARKACVGYDFSSGKWPCYFFQSCTTGEKPFEEFYTSRDSVDLDHYASVGVLHQSAIIDKKAVEAAIERMETIKAKPIWHKEEMVEAIKRAAPELDHQEKGRSLDQGM